MTVEPRPMVISQEAIVDLNLEEGEVALVFRKTGNLEAHLKLPEDLKAPISEAAYAMALVSCLFSIDPKYVAIKQKLMAMMEKDKEERRKKN